MPHNPRKNVKDDLDNDHPPTTDETNCGNSLKTPGESPTSTENDKCGFRNMSWSSHLYESPHALSNAHSSGTTNIVDCLSVTSDHVSCCCPVPPDSCFVPDMESPTVH